MSLSSKNLNMNLSLFKFLVPHCHLNEFSFVWKHAARAFLSLFPLQQVHYTCQLRTIVCCFFPEYKELICTWIFNPGFRTTETSYPTCICCSCLLTLASSVLRPQKMRGARDTINLTNQKSFRSNSNLKLNVNACFKTFSTLPHGPFFQCAMQK